MGPTTSPTRHASRRQTESFQNYSPDLDESSGPNGEIVPKIELDVPNSKREAPLDATSKREVSSDGLLCDVHPKAAERLLVEDDHSSLSTTTALRNRVLSSGSAGTTSTRCSEDDHDGYDHECFNEEVKIHRQTPVCVSPPVSVPVAVPVCVPLATTVAPGRGFSSLSDSLIFLICECLEVRDVLRLQSVCVALMRAIPIARFNFDIEAPFIVESETSSYSRPKKDEQNDIPNEKIVRNPENKAGQLVPTPAAQHVSKALCHLKLDYQWQCMSEEQKSRLLPFLINLETLHVDESFYHSYAAPSVPTPPLTRDTAEAGQQPVGTSQPREFARGGSFGLADADSSSANLVIDGYNGDGVVLGNQFVQDRTVPNEQAVPIRNDFVPIDTVAVDLGGPERGQCDIAVVEMDSNAADTAASRGVGSENGVASSNAPAVVGGDVGEFTPAYGDANHAVAIVVDDETAAVGENSPAELGNNVDDNTGDSLRGAANRAARNAAFAEFCLVLKIAIQSRKSLKLLSVDGMSPRSSFADDADDAVPELPREYVRASRRPECDAERRREREFAGPREDGDEKETTTENSADEEHRPFVFPLLRHARFGRTVDCRHIVPFVDFCCLPSLQKLSVGHITVQYEFLSPQFGFSKAPTVILAPQLIFGAPDVFAAETAGDPDSIAAARAELDAALTSPHLPAAYNGPLDAGFRFEGEGVYASHHYCYEGSFHEGLNHGYGSMLSREGERYDGYWHQGRRHGKGRVVQPDKRELVGEWKRDVFEGYGRMTTPEGLRYDGYWQQHAWHGWGVLSYRRRLVVFGQFSSGALHGWARVFAPDGSYSEEGFFRIGVPSTKRRRVYTADPSVGGLGIVEFVGEDLTSRPDVSGDESPLADSPPAAAFLARSLRATVEYESNHPAVSEQPNSVGYFPMNQNFMDNPAVSSSLQWATGREAPIPRWLMELVKGESAGGGEGDEI